MAFDAIFQGPPSTIAATGAASPAFGVDAVNQNFYLTTANGWRPSAPSVVSKLGLTGQTANVAAALTFAVPANLTGLYEVGIYLESTNTPTGATIPAVTCVYTDADTGNSVTLTQADVTSVSAANVINSGILVCKPKGGTNIVLATTSYAAGSGTALAYSAHLRITYVG